MNHDLPSEAKPSAAHCSTGCRRILFNPWTIVSLILFLGFELCTLGVIVIREYGYDSLPENKQPKGIRTEIRSSPLAGSMYPFIISWCDSEQHTDVIGFVDWDEVPTKEVIFSNLVITYPDGTKEKVAGIEGVTFRPMDAADDYSAERLLRLRKVRASYESFSTQVEATTVSDTGVRTTHILQTRHGRGNIKWWWATYWENLLAS